jgi:hypothetical protein
MIDKNGNHGEIVVEKGMPGQKYKVTASQVFYSYEENAKNFDVNYLNGAAMSKDLSAFRGWNGTFNLPSYDATFRVTLAKPFKDKMDCIAAVKVNPVGNVLLFGPSNECLGGKDIRFNDKEHVYNQSLSHEVSHTWGLPDAILSAIPSIANYESGRRVTYQDVDMVIDPAIE